VKAIGTNVTGVQGDVAKLDHLDRLYETISKVKNMAAKNTAGLTAVTSFLLSFRGNCRARLYFASGSSACFKR
jgi:hypothetical protein